MNRNWKLLILLSLFLNVLLIGFFIGKATSVFHPPMPPKGLHHPPGHPMLHQLMQRQFEQLRPLDRQIEQLRRQSHQLLLQDTPNKAEYDALTEQLKSLHNQKFEQLSEALFNEAKQLSPPQRQQLVDALNRLPPPPPAQ